MQLAKLIFPKVDLATIAHALDGVGHEARVHTVKEWGAREMAPLFEAAADNPAVTLEDLVPSDREPMTEVIHHGKNTLPVFTHFQKRFCRPPEGEPAEQLWGYNHSPASLFVGPGYFVVHPWAAGGVVIDYTMLPPKKPDAWPAIKSNSAGLSRLVNHNLKDVMRKLSQHVTIGRAQRGDDHVMDAWFVLVREDPSAT